MYRCDNCGRECPGLIGLARVFPDIPGLLERIEPGGRVPAAECPDCGALVYDCAIEEAGAYAVPALYRLVDWIRGKVETGAILFENDAPYLEGMLEDLEAMLEGHRIGAIPRCCAAVECRFIGEAVKNARQPARVLILLEGGLVREVIADTPAIEVAVLDTDIDGLDLELNPTVRLESEDAAHEGTLSAIDPSVDIALIEAAWRTPEA